MKLQPINKKGASVLAKLTRGLRYPGRRQLGAVAVYRTGNDLYTIEESTAVLFWKKRSGWYPIECTQYVEGTCYHDRVLWVEKGIVVQVRPKDYRNLVAFCGEWLEALRRQQGL